VYKKKEVVEMGIIEMVAAAMVKENWTFGSFSV
jgi:hypothetical protein